MTTNKKINNMSYIWGTEYVFEDEPEILFNDSSSTEEKKQASSCYYGHDIPNNGLKVSYCNRCGLRAFFNWETGKYEIER